MTSTIIAPLVAAHQPSTSHRPNPAALPVELGVIDDIERDDNARGPMRDETDTAFFDLVQQLLVVPSAGPACCGQIMEPTGAPGCWRCPQCGATVTPFHLATAAPAAPTSQYSCCGRPMTQRGVSRWECDRCHGWTEESAHHISTASTPPAPLPQRQKIAPPREHGGPVPPQHPGRQHPHIAPANSLVSVGR
ncbi:hypothetical protein [Streptomyces xiamenensis]|uniref:hypothetical protein n=1 Tax=Streptomyces xiamenensis TaxID=408015 RepID=UPI0035E2F836